VGGVSPEAVVLPRDAEAGGGNHRALGERALPHVDLGDQGLPANEQPPEARGGGHGDPLGGVELQGQAAPHARLEAEAEALSRLADLGGVQGRQQGEHRESHAPI